MLFPLNDVDGRLTGLLAVGDGDWQVQQSGTGINIFNFRCEEAKF